MTESEQATRGPLTPFGGTDDRGGSGGSGMRGHVEVNDTPTMVSEDDQDEEDAEASGGNGKEIDRDQVANVVHEERPPRLGGRGAPLREQPGDGAFCHIDAELK